MGCGEKRTIIRDKGRVIGAPNAPVDPLCVCLPTCPTFSEAVQHTPKAQLTAEGLTLELIRYQKPSQAGQVSIRTGVFYLTDGDKNTRMYTKSDWLFGGQQRVVKQTLIRRPLFVKGAVGGNVGVGAYKLLKGAKAYKEMEREAKFTECHAEHHAERVRQFLEKYGDPRLADALREYGKPLVWVALVEHAIAHAVRDAGYDAVVGHSIKKDQPYISEIYCVLETNYPVPAE